MTYNQKIWAAGNTFTYTDANKYEQALADHDKSLTALNSGVLTLTGAAADGVTDDTTAFQNAFDALTARGGGILIVPPTAPGKSYYISVTTCPVIPSNIVVFAHGAVFTSTDVNIRAVFVVNTPSNVTPGYGAGAQNVQWFGGRFLGDFSAGITLCAFAVHHLQHALFDGITFEQCHGDTGHVYDIGAGDDIKIRNCVFIGMMAAAGSEQVEAVNVDLSYLGTLTGGTAQTGASGLASRDVTVELCKFLPFTDTDSTYYPCSNPMGTHICREGEHYERIRFIDNYVEGLPSNPPTSTADGSTDDFYRGAVHFPCVDGFWMTGNKFYNTQGVKTRALTIMSQDYGVLASSNLGGATTRGTFATPLDARNVWVHDNEFRGFNNADPLAIVYVKGVTGAYADGIHIYDNEYRDGPSVSGAGGPAGCAVYAQYVNDCHVDRNSVTDFYRAISIWDGTNVSADDNVFTRCKYRTVLTRDANGFSINGNKSFNCGPFQLNQSANANGQVCNNSINHDSATAPVDLVGIKLDASDYIVVTGNVIHNHGSVVMTLGIDVAGLVSSIVSQNIVLGFTTAINTPTATNNSIGSNITA